MSPEDRAFAAFASRVKGEVEERLAREVARTVARAEGLSPRARDVVAALGDLATRGGKRVRAVLLLHAYLLVHDDWMDEDEVRRGGPSVHVMLRSAIGDNRLGDAAAILAGDFGSAVAQRLLLEVDLPAVQLAEAARVFARIQEDVVLGQTLDLLDASCDVETKHDLKTGSYTVRGPLALGAALAGASEERRQALERFGAPLGVAFQLKDDLLGVFGAPRETGKPLYSDLRQGKRTALIAALSGDREAALLMPRVFGVPDASDDEARALANRLVTSGARAKVEARIEACLVEAEAALGGAPFEDASRLVLEGAIRAIGRREK
jgi:geranylgeranyl diphosphate synthase type I